jgi:hypothetical protein
MRDHTGPIMLRSHILNDQVLGLGANLPSDWADGKANEIYHAHIRNRAVLALCKEIDLAKWISQTPTDDHSWRRELILLIYMTWFLLGMDLF